MEHFYTWILTENLRVLLVPGTRELVLPAMVAFGKQDLLLFHLAAACGMMLGMVPVWAIGRWLIRYRDDPRSPLSDALYLRLCWHMKRWGWALLMLVPLGVAGVALGLVAGFTRLPLWISVLTVGVARLFLGF